ncbi:hypothetical protein [Nocardia sp. NRRL S-836]|uniref:hypothetical protein n=1 Tax=Nocardia sp. NRRL S-836 TaxID=1519492 RepID=UPI0006AF739D|nr:hypothetical protein [Nocardia sp. NRRL S-836]KOV90050.1 hypothetical protein ADL03_01405 [Nocardia sp. NRRL S-836]
MNTRTLAVAAALSAAVLLSAGPLAHADEPVSAADLRAARAAATAQSTVDAVTDFLGDLRARDGQNLGATSVTVQDGVVPVYTLAPEFVSGAQGAQPGRLAYLAVPATSGDGRTSTIQTVRGRDGRWEVGNLASGDQEFRLAANLPTGATLLHEPQVNAWYAGKGGELTVLDPGGSGRAAGERLTVADYQRAVHQAYGDKQRGSDYAAKGMAGGYAAQPDSGVPVLPLAGLAALALLGSVTFVVRSLRRG